MASREHRTFHDVEQTKKIAPFITRKAPFSQHVCELVLGVNIFDLDLGVKEPIQRDTVGSRHVSHRRTSSFDDHLDHCLVILKNVHLCFTLTRICVCILVPFFPQPDVSNAQAASRCSLDSAFICRILLG